MTAVQGKILASHRTAPRAVNTGAMATEVEVPMRRAAYTQHEQTAAELQPPLTQRETAGGDDGAVESVSPTYGSESAATRTDANAPQSQAVPAPATAANRDSGKPQPDHSPPAVEMWEVTSDGESFAVPARSPEEAQRLVEDFIQGDPCNLATELRRRREATRAFTRKVHLERRPHTIYKLYDAKDRLLYVGISANGPARLTGHAASKPWWDKVVRADFEHVSGRAAAEARERALIVELRPRWNVAHKPIEDSP